MSQGFAATMQEQLIEGGRWLVSDGDVIEVLCDGDIVEGIEVVVTDCDMGVGSELSIDAYLYTCL